MEPDNLQEREAKARYRAQVIWDVRSGKLTATAGATLLGISRQCYYGWEERALSGMAEALMDREAGRPANTTPDSEKEALERKLAALTEEVATLRRTASIREALQPFAEWRNPPPDPGKKSPKRD